MSEQNPAQYCADKLKALSDPERLRIVECLANGPRNVSAIADALASEIANVSHHLGVLKHSGLVQMKRQGKFVIYSLHPDVVRNQESDSKKPILNFGCCQLDLNSENQ